MTFVRKMRAFNIDEIDTRSAISPRLSGHINKKKHFPALYKNDQTDIGEEKK